MDVGVQHCLACGNAVIQAHVESVGIELRDKLVAPPPSCSEGFALKNRGSAREAPISLGRKNFIGDISVFWNCATQRNRFTSV